MFDLSKLKIRPSGALNFDPPATDEQIQELENYCKHKLPDSYKEILKHYNGGYPELNLIDYIDEDTGVPLEGTLGSFYSLSGNIDELVTIWWILNNYSELFPENSLPFATNINEQIYYMKWVNNIPEVWRLSYVFEEEFDDRKIANSFDQFLGSLYY